jgi:hypothetical protein
MLGLVLSPYGKVPGAWPYEINKSATGYDRYLCPYDPYYIQRGEEGFFHDTPFGGPRITRVTLGPRGRTLGAIPTDAELATVYQEYTPVQSGWIAAIDPKRYIPGPWVPPNNANALWPYGPSISFNGLGEGEAAVTDSITAASANDVIKVLNEYHKKQFALSALAAAAGIAASAVAFYRTFQGIKHDAEEHKKDEQKKNPTLSGHRRRKR